MSDQPWLASTLADHLKPGKKTTRANTPAQLDFTFINLQVRLNQPPFKDS